MKRFAYIAAGLAAVLLILAALTEFTIAPSLKYNSVNKVDSTATSNVTGSILNNAKFQSTPTDANETVTMTSTRVTTANTAVMAETASKEADAAVWDTTNTVTRNDTGEVILSSSARYAFNRKSSELQDCCGANINGDTALDFQGIMPLKFPFDAPQSDVPVFDATLKTVVPASFVGTREIEGMTVNEYKQVVPLTQVPGEAYVVLDRETARLLMAVLQPDLVPQIEGLPADQPVGLFQYYQAESNYLVEPITGQIVDGSVTARTSLRLNAGANDIVVVSDLTATSADVVATVKEVKADLANLRLVGTTIPVVLVILALLALAAAVVMWVRSPRKSSLPIAAAPADPTADAEADPLQYEDSASATAPGSLEGVADDDSGDAKASQQESQPQPPPDPDNDSGSGRGNDSGSGSNA